MNNIKENLEFSWLWVDPNNPEKQSAKWSIIRMQGNEASLLHKYCKLINGNSVEVGRRYGGSLYIMASATPGTVYSIDIKSIERCIGDNKTRLKFKDKILNNLSKFSNIKMIIDRSDSVVINDTYDLLFIDSNHGYINVLGDTIHYWNNLTTYAIYHDYHTIGVKTIVDAGVACGLFKIIDIAESKRDGVVQPSLVVVKKLKEIDAFLKYIPNYNIEYIYKLLSPYLDK